jgi:hypothetical protein
MHADANDKPLVSVDAAPGINILPVKRTIWANDCKKRDF